jgi:ABC-type uncharacterized transport system substrate-binding protein
MPETITGDRQAARGRFSATPSLPDLFWRAADFVDKILRGAKPGGIRSSSRPDLISFVNLTTAKALGLTIPAGVLALADEVIE